MPSGGVCAAVALGAILFYYGIKPVEKVAKKTGHGICYVFTAGQKCKPAPKGK